MAESLDTFHHLEGLGGAKIKLNVEGVYGTYFLNVRRDVATLTCRELSLLTELAATYFGDRLIEEYDENYFPDEEYLIAQEDYLECANMSASSSTLAEEQEVSFEDFNSR